MSDGLTGRWDDKYDVCECGWYRHYHGILLDSVCQGFRLTRSAYNPEGNPR